MTREQIQEELIRYTQVHENRLLPIELIQLETVVDFIHKLASDGVSADVSDSDCCHPSIMYINSKWKFFCVECGQTGIESDR